MYTSTKIGRNLLLWHAFYLHLPEPPRRTKKLEAETLLYTERALDFSRQKEIAQWFTQVCSGLQLKADREQKKGKVNTHTALCVTHWSFKKTLRKPYIGLCQKQTKMITLMMAVVYFLKGYVLVKCPCTGGLLLCLSFSDEKKAIPVRVYLFLSSR